MSAPVLSVRNVSKSFGAVRALHEVREQGLLMGQQQVVAGIELMRLGQAEVDRQWREKIAAQNEKIALLQRELDVLQRENRLRASSYYGDAGSRLRNPGKYAEDDRQYRDNIAAKQKAIDDAKTELENMKEAARKAGASGG